MSGDGGTEWWVDADVLATLAFAHYPRRWITGICERPPDAASWSRLGAIPDPYHAAFRQAVSELESIHDQFALDPNPDRCWRCDALPATNDLGLCDPCHASLT